MLPLQGDKKWKKHKNCKNFTFFLAFKPTCLVRNMYIYILKVHLEKCLEILYLAIAKYSGTFLDALKTSQNSIFFMKLASQKSMFDYLKILYIYIYIVYIQFISSVIKAVKSPVLPYDGGSTFVMISIYVLESSKCPQDQALNFVSATFVLVYF